MGSLYLLFGIAVLAVVCAIALAVLGVRCGGRNIPVPPEHLRPKIKSVPMFEPPTPLKKDIQFAVPRKQNADELLNKTISGIPNLKYYKN